MSATCPLCHGRSFSPLFTSANGYPIRRCSACELVSTGSRTAEKSDELYPPIAAPRGGWSLVHRILQAGRIATVERAKPSGRLLDFGAGDGGFARLMAKRGYEVVGLDPTSIAADARGKNLTLYRAPFEKLARRLGSFDIITLWQVLEHLADPVATLRRLRKHLAPGGVLIVSVPNFASLQGALFRGRWFHLDPPKHLLHFERATLEACLRRAGLAPLAKETFSAEYGPAGWIQSILNNVLPYPNYLHEWTKGRRPPMSRTSATLALGTSVFSAAVLFAPSLIAEWGAARDGRGAVLTVVSTLDPEARA